MPLSICSSLSGLLSDLKVRFVDLCQDFSRIHSIGWISVHILSADAPTLL